MSTIPAPTEAPQRAEFYPISPYLSLPSLWTAIPSAIGLACDIILSHAHAIPLFLLWTAHPPAIGSIPGLLSLIPDWPTQSTGLLYNHNPFMLGSLIPDDGGSTYLRNVGRQLFYMAVHPRRQLWTKLTLSKADKKIFFLLGRQLFYTAVHPRRQFWTSCRNGFILDKIVETDPSNKQYLTYSRTNIVCIDAHKDTEYRHYWVFISTTKTVENYGCSKHTHCMIHKKSIWTNITTHGEWCYDHIINDKNAAGNYCQICIRTLYNGTSATSHEVSMYNML
jgi:hypothetical protein